MPLKHLVMGLAIVATIPTAFTTAEAADGLYVPLLHDRTGPFAGSGIPYANGLTDYLNMLNQRDGGIGGIKLDHGGMRDRRLNTKKGCVMLMNSVKGKDPVRRHAVCLRASRCN